MKCNSRLVRQRSVLFSDTSDCSNVFRSCVVYARLEAPWLVPCIDPISMWFTLSSSHEQEGPRTINQLPVMMERNQTPVLRFRICTTAVMILLSNQCNGQRHHLQQARDTMLMLVCLCHCKMTGAEPINADFNTFRVVLFDACQ